MHVHWLDKRCFFTELPNTESFFQKFRVAMKGKNSNNQLYLCLSGFEVYGSLFENGQVCFCVIP